MDETSNQDELFPGNRVDRPVRVINADDERYERFVAAYCENGFNGTRAAIAAGYSEATAYSQASRLLKRPEIADAIAARAEDARRRLDCSLERVLQENARIVLNDPGRMYDEDGRMLPIEQMDEDTRRAIASVEVRPTKFGLVRVVRFWDKGAAIDRRMRTLGMYKDKTEHAVKFSLEDLIVGSNAAHEE
jgi:phage terminase small subunit